MHRRRVAVSRLQTQIDPLGDSSQVPTRCRGRNLPGSWSPRRLSDDENGGGYAGHTRCARFWQGPSHAVSTRFNAFPTPFQRHFKTPFTLRLTPFQRLFCKVLHTVLHRCENLDEASMNADFMIGVSALDVMAIAKTTGS